VRDQQVLGITFRAGEPRAGAHWVAHGGADATYTLGPGRLDLRRAVRAGQAFPQRTPWPEHSFLIHVDGGPRGFRLTLPSGEQVQVTGAAFARLLHGLESFRYLTDYIVPDALVLVSSGTGALGAPWGAAASFQHELTRLTAEDRPVVAPTRSVVTGVVDGVGGITAVTHDGRWRVFASDSTPFVASDAEGRTVFVDPDEVWSEPLTQGDRTIGVTFQKTRSTEVPPGTEGLVLATDAVADTLTVYLANGQAVAVDVHGFAQAFTWPLRHLFGGQAPDRFTVLVSGSSTLEPMSFQRALSHVVGVKVPVVVQSVEATP
jgi:hypothetical protein